MSNHSAAGSFTSEAAFDALGDPNRRRILECLRAGARPVGELARELPIGRPAVSKHLRVLENAGLVEHSARGTRNLYALAPDGLRELQGWLVGLWDTSLQSFADFVAEHAEQQPPAESTPAESRTTP